MRPALAERGTAPTRYGYIDAVRAIAVIGVMAVHVSLLFREMPYHASALAELGAQGVQMFFVVSSLTLMLSWHSRRATDPAPVFAFYVRRLFRIAPMFWLALLIYSGLHPLWRQFWQEGVFGIKSVILTVFFIHGWLPDTINAVVPGGWTIGVEMSFYLIFPFVASILTNLRRAILSCLLMVVASALLNSAFISYVGHDIWADNLFLNYWLPNQLPSFALGFAAYFTIAIFPRVRWLPPTLLAVIAGICWFTAFGGAPYIASIARPITRGTLVAIATYLLVLTLSQRPYRILVNPMMRHIGKVSFSAYLVHFLVVESVRLAIGPSIIRMGGMLAIGTYAAVLIFVVAISVAASTITYRSVEAPMIALGNKLLDRRRLRLAAI